MLMIELIAQQFNPQFECFEQGSLGDIGISLIMFIIIIIFMLLLMHCPRIPNVGVTQEEGEQMELEVSDDPYDVKRLDVSAAPTVVTLSKVSFHDEKRITVQPSLKGWTSFLLLSQGVIPKWIELVKRCFLFNYSSSVEMDKWSWTSWLLTGF